ncbi:LysR substrate-binding domain-containing protein [Rhodospirillum sp. A1_3_36]|uniref:LysR substrate-binding domain-containing protein n=1 Tax=Rhodospirillum sp. A1_3_36 TaxID=3391666 RepID=UPI0039A5AB5B
MAIRFSLLHTFVVVARSGRMRDAAEVLSLTPGAISQRVRALEEIMGHRLFDRTGSGIVLNGAGLRLFESLDGPFRQIEVVDGDLGRGAGGLVRISATAAFTENWLVPRLPRFSALHPAVDLSLETENRLVDPRSEPVDLAIRHGLGGYPDLESVWLMAPEMVVVGAPSLLADRSSVSEPADCLSFALLHDLQRADWRLWFEAHGVPVSRDLRGPAFSNDSLLIAAAEAGQGIALVREVHAEEALRAGRLVQMIARSWPSRFAYYAVTTREALERPAVRHVRDWLVEEAQRFSIQMG